MLTVLGGLAEFERELVRARTGEGREGAKARRVEMEPKFKLTAHQQREAIKRRDHGEETLAEIGPQLQRVRLDDFEAYERLTLSDADPKRLSTEITTMLWGDYGMILAIFQNERYEGNAYSLNALYPMPSLSPVVVDQITPRLFREDSFDPTTRIRRGRFYIADSPSRKAWPSGQVNHYPYAQPVGGQPPIYQMDAYRSSPPDRSAMKSLILLGDASYNTAWHVIGAERLFNSDTLFTFKSANTLGTLPDLVEGALPTERRKQILDGFEKVADAAHKYMPVSIVDVCREFARIILAAWLSTVGGEPEGDDLGNLIKAVPDDGVGIKSAAEIINRLHPRGKSSEQERQAQKGRDIRDVSDEEGELSVSLVGFLLREFRWASELLRLHKG
jgi:hypothetical protein